MVRLTHNIGDIHELMPSPDGSMIAYCVAYGIYVMDSDGTNHKELVSGYYPAWTPDSKYIVYTFTDNFGSVQFSDYLWKISIDGKEKIQITKNHQL
jgi:Tol biopolymer transport system component